jgi:hypothetical protein
MDRIRRHFTSAHAIALVALMVALGGTGYAAFKLPNNSVGTKQIKNNAVTSAKVKNRSLKAGDFKKGQLPRGKTGPKGIQGLPGQQGVAGQPGPTGPTGAAGTAVAFARIAGDGTLVGGDPEQKGITVANIQHTAGAPAAEVTGDGVYCIGGLDFTPTSAVVALDNTDALPAVPNLTGGSLNFIASVAVFKGEDLGRCDATHGQARVAIEQVNDTAAPTLANHGFFIWFQ